MRFPKKLAASANQLFAVKEADRAGLSVRVTSLEHTLVDVLDRPDPGGRWKEIWRSLEMVEFFDLDVVIEYTLLLENATTAAKVGFFLEQHKEALMVEVSHLESLRAYRPRKPHYLVRGQRGGGGGGGGGSFLSGTWWCRWRCSSAPGRRWCEDLVGVPASESAYAVQCWSTAWR